MHRRAFSPEVLINEVSLELYEFDPYCCFIVFALTPPAKVPTRTWTLFLRHAALSLRDFRLELLISFSCLFFIGLLLGCLRFCC